LQTPRIPGHPGFGLPHRTFERISTSGCSEQARQCLISAKDDDDIAAAESNTPWTSFRQYPAFLIKLDA
jgi:hypothetical protein